MKGKIITGVSGGEFGIVGRVDAWDAKTGEKVWSRPVIEVTLVNSTVSLRL